MKYSVGDTILILHSKEEGKVVDIMSNDMLMVEVKGVTFPVYYDQIDFPYFHRFTAQKDIYVPKPLRGEEIKKEKPFPVTREETGVFLSLLPVWITDGYDERVSILKYHLLNETARTYNVHFQIFLGNQLHLEIKNEVHPFQHFYLADLLFEQLNDQPRFEFAFSLKPADPKMAASFSKGWKVKAKQLFLQLNELKVKEQATISYPLFEQYPLRQDNEPMVSAKHLATGISAVNYQAVTGKKEEPKYEVDLHIEKLTADYKSMSNLEILAIQLNEFQHWLDIAIAHHQHSMVAIHGVGKGKLREELHDILKVTPEVKSFVNQYHPLYGYGATEIYFK